MDIRSLDNKEILDAQNLFRATFISMCNFELDSEKRDNFEKLEPEKVLGLAETSIEFGIIKSLDYLQTNPKFLNKVQPTIKHIGTAMLKFIENINKGHRIAIDSVKEAKAFYMKNGYKRLEEYTNIFFKDV